MRKVITFLGVNPRKTDYFYRGRAYSGEVFAEALAQFLDFDQMLVFVTEQARREVYPILEALGDDRINPVSIPTGETESEMWEIFQRLTDQVEPGDRVIFDITHGLRSLPFLIFLAAAFLKVAKQVQIEKVLYGAWELRRDASGNPRPAPVIELSEFVNLLDWMIATDHFVRLGNGRALATLLREAKPSHTLQQSDPGVKAQAKSISRAATALEKVSRALRLILPDQAMEQSEALQKDLSAAATAIQERAKPFSILSQMVLDAYAPLALPAPRDLMNVDASLARERMLVKWYLERNLYVQAIAVAREWLITWALIQGGFTNPYDKETRKEVEEALGKALTLRRREKRTWRDLTFSTGVNLQSIPYMATCIDIFDQVGQVRNTLLHAGKRPQRMPAETLEKQVKTLCQRLNELPLP